MLRRLCLELAGRRNPGHQGEVNEHHLLGPQLVAELTDRLQEGQALDVAHRAADLDQREVERLAVIADGVLCDRLFDRIGDVRDHLHRRAQVITAALAGDDVLIDAPCRRIVGAASGNPGEALVMAEIKIGLRPIIRDEHLAMLIGRHRARIDVEIRVELAQPHRIAARLQQRAEGGRGDALAEGGNHATGDKYKPCHGRAA